MNTQNSNLSMEGWLSRVKGISRPVELPNNQTKAQDSGCPVLICGSDITTVHRKGTEERIIKCWNQMKPEVISSKPCHDPKRKRTWQAYHKTCPPGHTTIRRRLISRIQVHLLPCLKPSPLHFTTLVKTQLQITISFSH